MKYWKSAIDSVSKLVLRADKFISLAEIPCPGPWIPPDINEWYTRLTKAVSESFYSLDQFLIRLEMDSFHKDDLNFIFSPESRIYEAQAVLSHKASHPASGPGKSGFPPVFWPKRWK